MYRPGSLRGTPTGTCDFGHARYDGFSRRIQEEFAGEANFFFDGSRTSSPLVRFQSPRFAAGKRETGLLRHQPEGQLPPRGILVASGAQRLASNHWEFAIAIQLEAP
jgi:hypothetical protein